MGYFNYAVNGALELGKTSGMVGESSNAHNKPNEYTVTMINERLGS